MIVGFLIIHGSTGPTGAAGGIAAYGGMYRTTTTPISIGIASTQQVAFNNTMPLLNTTVAANAITVANTGIYEINWKLVSTASVAVALTLAIRRNSVPIASTTSTRTLSLGVESLFEGSVIFNLTAGDVIDMALSSALAVTLTLSTGTNATLTVKQLS
ncbi:BclA C-terminal domain-containing protein [Enterocloster bolteae]|uniref:BclA C-terminal domain-containing protein n=1 Tax=Enterocloster bolteae TaxID=208479 RepID=UPI001F2F4D87|nr:hypothetical protein [Enterocloster bolteae]UOX70874.1 hypothetical protein K4205_04245 [Enterocloster bolteae]